MVGRFLGESADRGFWVSYHNALNFKEAEWIGGKRIEIMVNDHQKRLIRE